MKYDRSAIIKEQRVKVPYTVRDITDIAEWRLKQADKEAAWQDKKVKRHADVIARLQDGTIEDIIEDSETTKAYKKYQQNKAINRQFESQVAINCRQLSLLNRIKLWFVDLFTNIK